MGTSKSNAGGNHAMDEDPIQKGVGITVLIVASCYGDQYWPDGTLGL